MSAQNLLSVQGGHLLSSHQLNHTLYCLFKRFICHLRSFLGRGRAKGINLGPMFTSKCERSSVTVPQVPGTWRHQGLLAGVECSLTLKLSFWCLLCAVATLPCLSRYLIYPNRQMWGPRGPNWPSSSSEILRHFLFCFLLADLLSCSHLELCPLKNPKSLWVLFFFFFYHVPTVLDHCGSRVKGSNNSCVNLLNTQCLLHNYDCQAPRELQVSRLNKTCGSIYKHWPSLLGFEEKNCIIFSQVLNLWSVASLRHSQIKKQDNSTPSINLDWVLNQINENL